VNAAPLRVLLIGGLISYRALFNWARPAIYIPTMLGSPLFQVLFFAYLGRYNGLEDDAFFVIGNAVQASAMAGIYGMTLTIANERQLGTLSAILATPANRAALFLGRALPNVANGIVVSAFAFTVGALAFDVHVAPGQMGALALVVLVSIASCTSLGMLIGAIGLRARDVFFASNLVYFLMLLLCGVNVPLSVLPDWMQAIGRSVPLTHGIEAARKVAAGASLASVADLVLTEAAIGAAYATAAFLLFRWLERASRRSAALDRL
jgi:ABC-2 type transport system permease protein